MKFGVITMIDIGTKVLLNVMPCSTIHGDSRGKVNMMGGDIIGHCEKNKVHINARLILVTIISILTPNSVRFLFVMLDVGRSLQNQVRYSRRIAGCHFVCCWLREDGLRRAARDLHTRVAKCNRG